MTKQNAPEAESESSARLGSAFQQAVHHAYAQIDGTYAWPNSREGDMLREAKREIERLTKCLRIANEQAEHFEREWYLRGDALERIAERTGSDEPVMERPDFEYGPQAEGKQGAAEKPRFMKPFAAALLKGGLGCTERTMRSMLKRARAAQPAAERAASSRQGDLFGAHGNLNKGLDRAATMENT